MTFKKAALSILALALVTTPALAQGRWGEQAKENAERRAQAAAIREMEAQYEKEAAQANAPLEAAAAPDAPADPAAPAEPEAATPDPAPAQ